VFRDAPEEEIMLLNTARILDRPPSSVPTAQQFVTVLSRQRRLAIAAFAVTFGAVIVFGLLLSERYEARMEILVEQLRRGAPVLTGGSDTPAVVNDKSTTEETLNSEIALLRSQDAMKEVVVACGLDSKESRWDSMRNRAAGFLPFLHQPTQGERTANAIQRLTSKLRIEVLKMSNIIVISYRSNDRQLAARVLNTLGDVYLEEHARAHRPAGELEFFQKETGEARAQMEDAEQNLVRFTRTAGVASGQTELNDALRRLSDVQAQQGEIQTAIAGTERRIGTLTEQTHVIPERQTTLLRTSDSAILQQQLKSSLLNLEMRRTELLTKFQQNYPLVVEVEKQIVQARTALADAEAAPIQEKTTDRDLTYEMVREDLARSSTELATLHARASSLDQQAAEYRARVGWLQKQSVAQGDLIRITQAAENNYMLLLHKQEEARISDELDSRRIFNVSIVQRASVPELPVHAASWYLMYGAMLGMIFSFATAAGADRLDPTFRTLDELELVLQVPVLAALPLPVSRALSRIPDPQALAHSEND
jgi:uncharacterized protein involved in exopolysaccharide biosynthesis